MGPIGNGVGFSLIGLLLLLWMRSSLVGLLLLLLWSETLMPLTLHAILQTWSLLWLIRGLRRPWIISRRD